MAGSAQSQVVLEAEQLGFGVDASHPIVQNASLQVGVGEIVAIAGPNGAGKSTLIRMLAGLQSPHQGSIKLFGKPLETYSHAERARLVAYVGQRDEPDRRLTIYDYVALGRIPLGARVSNEQHENAIRQALHIVELQDLQSSRLGEVSGGELQRASIARILCQEPEILFLDEPTNHLDPKAKGTLLSLVVSRGITTVCVLHDLALIPKLANRTVLMDQSKIVASGETAQVLTAETVQQVFGVDLLHLAHPTQDRFVSVLDIPVSRTPSTPN